MVMKPNGKSPVSSSNDQEVMLFKDISPDVVGNMKLVNGQSHIERRILDEVEIATTPRTCYEALLLGKDCNRLLQEIYSLYKHSHLAFSHDDEHKTSWRVLFKQPVTAVEILQMRGIIVPVTVTNQRKQSVLNMDMRAFTTHLRGFTPSFAVSVFLFQFEHWVRLSF
ncbi:hypothetical protein Rs2_35035 [Raphanus sativus]|nr:hypothetical protein Rs2_35035 [Raphanus sativus]